MKAIYRYLAAYLKAHYNGPLYAGTILFTAVLLYFNYKYDFEDDIIDAYYGSNLRILWFFLIHSLSYYGVCLLVWVFTRNRGFIRQKEFWGLSIAGFLVLAFYRGHYYTTTLATAWSPDMQTFKFIYRVISKGLPLFTVVLPLALFYRVFFRRRLGHFYGLQLHHVHLKPYWVLLAAMLPIIAVASFQPDFLKLYPNYQHAGLTAFAQYYQLHEPALITFYEVCYAFGFFVVELFFRGFLIFGLVKYLGEDVVLPMAVTYCVLHFGKPLGEAISSFFGGYILGVIALRTQNIWGGVLVHVGIAWLMELFAFWQL